MQTHTTSVPLGGGYSGPKSVRIQALEGKESQIESLCRRLDVKELRIFGSAVTDGFDPRSSDVDFLAEFHGPDRAGIADRFMALAEGLESILQRPADLITRPALKNPVFRRVVEETSRPVYAA